MNAREVFYLHLAGEQRGPYTIPQIDHLLNSGLIGVETLYWREGLEQWQPVTSLVAIRKRPNPWIKPAIALGVLLVLALPVRIFGPVVLEGWQEANQHDFTGSAAYWRARDVVRNQALPHGTLVEFKGLETAQVELQTETSGALVKLRATLTDAQGGNQPAAWNVPMRFDPEAKEWSGGPPVAAP